jgi:ribosomal protein S25
MPIISEKKRQKIKEEILRVLFENSPKALYTYKIADEVIRDEEFTLTLLKELHKDNFVKLVNKNSRGTIYLARKRWTLKPKVYEAYKELL